MKDRIVFLIIGILIGAIIATAGFLIYNKVIVKNSNQTEMMQMNGKMGEPVNGNMGEPPAKPDENSQEEGTVKLDENNGEEPPAKPDGEMKEEPPAKPEDSNNNSNS